MNSMSSEFFHINSYSREFHCVLESVENGITEVRPVVLDHKSPQCNKEFYIHQDSPKGMKGFSDKMEIAADRALCIIRDSVCITDLVDWDTSIRPNQLEHYQYIAIFLEDGNILLNHSNCLRLESLASNYTLVIRPYYYFHLKRSLSKSEIKNILIRNNLSPDWNVVSIKTCVHKGKHFCRLSRASRLYDMPAYVHGNVSFTDNLLSPVYKMIDDFIFFDVVITCSVIHKETTCFVPCNILSHLLSRFTAAHSNLEIGISFLFNEGLTMGDT